MLQEIASFIHKYHLFSTRERLLLAVSGGVDSMTLLHLLVKLDHQLAVAHMNFGLRGEDSEKDQTLVESVCNDLHVPCFSKKSDTQAYATDLGISIQMAARDLRYQWFEQLMNESSYDLLVTAHNANDNLETILFNLTKGTGIRGLRGMKPLDGNRVRPMLSFPKEQIITYARANNIDWREDRSNQESKYLRNKIRQEVIPILQEINPSVLDHFESTRLRITGAEEAAMRYVRQIHEQFCDQTNHVFSVKLSWLQGDHADALILSELLRPYGFTYQDCAEVIKAIGHPGKIFHSPQFTLNVDRDQLVIVPKGTDVPDKPLEIEELQRAYTYDPWEISCSIHEVEEFKKNADPTEVFLDLDLIQLPLTVRTWESGDSFRPLGLHGHKKISDFLIDQKVPLIEKPAVMVMESAGQICWLVNHRLDDRFKVSEKTTRVLKITCRRNLLTID